MAKRVVLRDGREVSIRDMEGADLERSHDFFLALSEDDRKYLRVDVTRRGVVERRIAEIASGRVRRLVAVDDGAIVADGALELLGHGWGEGVAEIRLIVAGPYQRLGLGSLLARELYLLAAEHKVDRIVVRMMRPQEGAIRIFRKLGFHEEFVIPEHVRDREGRWQDLVIMRCNLEDLWREMEHMMAAADHQLHR